MLRLLLQTPLSLPFTGGRLFLHRISAVATAGDTLLSLLTTALHLSPTAAAAISTKLHHLKRKPNPTQTAQLVLSLLQSYHFTTPQLTNIFSRHPSLLLANPFRILKPKLDFLAQNGVSGTHLTHVISLDPTILRRSLKNQLIPCISALKSFFNDEGKMVSLIYMKRGTWVLHKFTLTMRPNIEILRAIGVPDDFIVKMMVVKPRTLSRDADEFREIVGKVESMGFDPKSMMFIHGVCVLGGMKKEKWEEKMRVFEGFGWTKAQVESVFVKQPKLMSASAEKIRKVLAFLEEELKWGAADFEKYPVVVFMSFERRVVPRCFVIKRLVEEGCMKREAIGTALSLSDDKFVNKFLRAYEKEIPGIVQMYQSKFELS